MFRLIQEFKPSWVIGENVSGHIKLGLDTVLENLESEGYSARTFSISASSIGANHRGSGYWRTPDAHSMRGPCSEARMKREKGPISLNGGQHRERLYGREDREHTEQRDSERQTGGEGSHDADTDSERLEGRRSECELRESQEEGQIGWSQWWQSEPNVGRVAHGVPKRVDRLKSLGNSLVPMIPYYIGMSIKKGDMLWTKK